MSIDEITSCAQSGDIQVDAQSPNDVAHWVADPHGRRQELAARRGAATPSQVVMGESVDLAG
jgi:hypothetical protein